MCEIKLVQYSAMNKLRASIHETNASALPGGERWTMIVSLILGHFSVKDSEELGGRLELLFLTTGLRRIDGRCIDTVGIYHGTE